MRSLFLGPAAHPRPLHLPCWSLVKVMGFLHCAQGLITLLTPMEGWRTTSSAFCCGVFSHSLAYIIWTPLLCLTSEAPRAIHSPWVYQTKFQIQEEKASRFLLQLWAYHLGGPVQEQPRWPFYFCSTRSHLLLGLFVVFKHFLVHILLSFSLGILFFLIVT